MENGATCAGYIHVGSCFKYTTDLLIEFGDLTMKNIARFLNKENLGKIVVVLVKIMRKLNSLRHIWGYIMNWYFTQQLKIFPVYKRSLFEILTWILLVEYIISLSWPYFLDFAFSISLSLSLLSFPKLEIFWEIAGLPSKELAVLSNNFSVVKALEANPLLVT